LTSAARVPFDAATHVGAEAGCPQKDAGTRNTEI
jgi:hypothetical protein